MLYALHELQRAFLDPLAAASDLTVRALTDRDGAPLLGMNGAVAGAALLHRLAKPFPKPGFGITSTTVDGRETPVREQVAVERPFCRLVRFERLGDHVAARHDPKILLCAPLSGHHATLLRDTVRALLPEHDVYVTDWVDARQVPVEQGPFHLDDYVHDIMGFVRHLGSRDLHVVSVCQPTVPVLAALSLLASAGEPTPRTLTLMGGPIDARRSPTAVNTLATTQPIGWFEDHLIHTVPAAYAGRGRRVYPGFLQLAAFVSMNPDRHLASYRDYFLDVLRGNSGRDAALAHERFYDEYNAVLDMDAAYYLETVRTVFQDFALARGVWDVRGVRVRPQDLTTTALFTVEGAEDDISGLGQTEAAHGLCTGIPDAMKQHHVAEGCGHYGIFSGRRWRESIAPRVRDFVRAHHSHA